MMVIPSGRRVLVASRPVDFRYGKDKLAALAQTWLDANAFGGDIFVFRARRSDRVKVLVWDGTGLCQFHKRLEAGRFVWPPITDGTIRLTPTQFTLLMDGLDWTQVRHRIVPRPAVVC